MIRRLLLASILVAAAAPGVARASGIRRDVNATTIHTQYMYLQPNTAYLIETTGLSAGGDTVLHVITDDGRGVPLASNDDCPGAGSLRSCVNIAASASWRLVAIMVRSYSPTSTGSATLRACGSWCDTFAVPRFAGTTLFSGDTLGINAKVMTVRRARQTWEPATARDTVLLAHTSAAAVAGFDDEHGLRSTPETSRRMSRIAMPLSCPSCNLTVGVPQWEAEGLVTVMWDTGGGDCDGDGWSDGLEQVAGGHGCLRDWDNDGLDDGEEFYGVETATESLQFPFWGANPMHKDVFVEADWVENTVVGGDPDLYRLTDAAAADAANRYQVDWGNHAGNPDGVAGFNIHFDSGRPNQGTLSGMWGGATRITTEVAKSNCGGMSSSRWGYFRHAVEHARGGGNGDQGGVCYNASFDDGWHNAHELGHNLGLNHGGTDASVQANCKPHYRSIMNYVYSPTFSPGTFASVPLNPTSLDETNPFGNDANLIGYLEQSPYYFTLERQNGVLTGNIDWNRDGIYEDAARGAPNFIQAGCEFGMMHRTVLPGGFSESFQARLGSDGVYWFAIDSSSRMTYRKALDLGACNQANPDTPCPGSWSAPLPVPDGAGGQVFAFGAGAAEWYSDPSNWYAPTIMLVYKRSSDQRLVFQALARDWWTGADVWSPAVPVGPILAPMPLDAEPTLVNLDGAMRLYVPNADNQILQLRFEWTTRSWVGEGVAVDSNGQALVVGAGPDGRGMSVVVGYQDDAGTPRRAVYGALRSPGDDRALMVRREIDGTWTRMTEAYAYNYQVKGVPRLGYVPFRSSEPSKGRFYLLYRPKGSVNTALAITEGNATGAATTRRLLFIRSATALNTWGNGNSSYSLMSDVDGLRATLNQWNPKTMGFDLWYLPFVDGVYNANFRDVNDFAVMATKVAL